MKVMDFFKEWSNKHQVFDKKINIERRIKVLTQMMEIKRADLEERNEYKNYTSIFLYKIMAFVSLIAVIFLTGEFQILSCFILLVSSVMASIKNSKKTKNELKIEKLIEEIKYCKKEIENYEKELSNVNIIANQVLQTLVLIEKYDLKEMLEYEITLPKKQLNSYLENEIPLFAILELMHSGKISMVPGYKNEFGHIKLVKALSKEIMQKYETDDIKKTPNIQNDVFEKLDDSDIEEVKKRK